MPQPADEFILDKIWQRTCHKDTFQVLRLPYDSVTMTATLENAARNLLSDPPWMRVFKNTYDSIEDQLNKVVSVFFLFSSLTLSSAFARHCHGRHGRPTRLSPSLWVPRLHRDRHPNKPSQPGDWHPDLVGQALWAVRRHVGGLRSPRFSLS